MALRCVIDLSFKNWFQSVFCSFVIYNKCLSGYKRYTERVFVCTIRDTGKRRPKGNRRHPIHVLQENTVCAEAAREQKQQPVVLSRSEGIADMSSEPKQTAKALKRKQKEESSTAGLESEKRKMGRISSDSLQGKVLEDSVMTRGRHDCASLNVHCDRSVGEYQGEEPLQEASCCAPDIQSYIISSEQRTSADRHGIITAGTLKLPPSGTMERFSHTDELCDQAKQGSCNVISPTAAASEVVIEQTLKATLKVDGCGGWFAAAARPKLGLPSATGQMSCSTASLLTVPQAVNIGLARFQLSPQQQPIRLAEYSRCFIPHQPEDSAGPYPTWARYCRQSSVGSASSSSSIQSVGLLTSEYRLLAMAISSHSGDVSPTSSSRSEAGSVTSLLQSSAIVVSKEDRTSDTTILSGEQDLIFIDRAALCEEDFVEEVIDESQKERSAVLPQPITKSGHACVKISQNIAATIPGGADDRGKVCVLTVWNWHNFPLKQRKMLCSERYFNSL